ncbi:MAG: hypothetical protein L3K09_02930 [Thermoplasmata archaeon]|nr:hypothetical protein [Thermoplasmata archaeon]
MSAEPEHDLTRELPLGAGGVLPPETSPGAPVPEPAATPLGRLWRSRNPKFLAALTVGCVASVVAAVAFILVFTGAPASPADPYQPPAPPYTPPLTIIYAGTVLQVAAHTYQDIAFSLDNASILNGTVHSSVAVSAYVMDASELANLSHGAPAAKAGYAWESPSATQTSVTPILNPGDYYLVFENTGSQTATLTVTADIDAADFDSN